MSHDRRTHAPVSPRHAFALAFDLGVRRDLLHSLIVPLLLRAPWILALGLLPPISQSDRPSQALLLTSVALFGDFVTQLVVGAMLRFRAQSVYNTAPGVHPAPVDECYAKGLARVPWLLVTEVARNVAIIVATFFLILPALFLGFRLSLATEAAVLSERDTAGAFQRSFRLSQGRFERWLEMVVGSVIIVGLVMFVFAALSVFIAGVSMNAWVAGTRLVVTAITPVIQYAWTFYFLRLIEAEAGWPGSEVGPAYAAADVPPWEGGDSRPELVVVHPERREGTESKEGQTG
jgi:hypothetical protein